MQQRQDLVREERKRERRYFRPSCLPALNLHTTVPISFDLYDDKTPLPPGLLDSPQHTVVNYFTILREASVFADDQYAGCGTVGMAAIPYPVAYQFLSEAYQKRLPFATYVKAFQGIGHISLIKLAPVVPVIHGTPGMYRYFIELETIEASNKKQTAFMYSYGYVDIQQEEASYKIADVMLKGEDFLCAPYHGWQHNAEDLVEIEYGGWCKLIRYRFPTQQEGYRKQVCFLGTDGYTYCFLFFQLTNGTDVLIAQYRRHDRQGVWELVQINPEDCLPVQDRQP